MTPPIKRVGGHGTDYPSVADLMAEQRGNEWLAWVWCESLLHTGHYDDSDYKEQVVVHYFAVDRDELERQMRRWLDEHPEAGDSRCLGSTASAAAGSLASSGMGGLR